MSCAAGRGGGREAGETEWTLWTNIDSRAGRRQRGFLVACRLVAHGSRKSTESASCKYGHVAIIVAPFVDKHIALNLLI